MSFSRLRILSVTIRDQLLPKPDFFSALKEAFGVEKPKLVAFQ